MLFNKDSKGTEEFKSLIGFIYKSLKFDDMKSYIALAERDLTQIIGKEIIKTAQNHYDSDDFQTEDQDDQALLLLDKLVNNMQMPLALNAYRLFAPGNDLSHDSTGRKMDVPEGQKLPFEWMLERDDWNLLELYHKFVDLLLEFLDENKDITNDDDQYVLSSWTESDSYLKSKKLLIPSAKIFNDHYYINESRRLFVALIPDLVKVEASIIKPSLTADLFAEIKEQLIDGDVTANNALIVELMRDALASYTMSKACMRLSIEVLPDGVFQNYLGTPGRRKDPAPVGDRKQLSKMIEQEAKEKMGQLQKLIRKLFPGTAAGDLDISDMNSYMDPDNKYLNL